MKVKITEVGPRDGLQNIIKIIPIQKKIDYLDRIIECGISSIELSSFVNQKRVPQLADAEQLFKLAQEKYPNNIEFSALVGNMTGLKRAFKANVKDVSFFVGASDSFNEKNLNQATATAINNIEEMVKFSKNNGMIMKGHVPMSFGCPYQGKITKEQVAFIVETYLNLGIHSITLNDTIGVASPDQVKALATFIKKYSDINILGIHFHDNKSSAIENVKAALDVGISSFDSAWGGIGGCPFAKGSGGNLATEKLVELLNSRGLDTPVNSKINNIYKIV